MLEQNIQKILYSEEEIIAKTKELGAQLTKDYQDRNPLLVGVLKGSVPFMAELMKHIDNAFSSKKYQKQILFLYIINYSVDLHYIMQKLLFLNVTRLLFIHPINLGFNNMHSRQ